MNAAKKRHIVEQPPGMSSALMTSLMIHGAVVIVGIFGLPYIVKERDPLPPAIPIEMVEISDKTMTDKPAERAVVKPVEDVKEPPKAEPERPKQAPKQVAEPPRPVAPPMDELALPAKEKDKPPEKKVEKKEIEKPKPKPKPRPVLTEEKPAEAQEDPFASLLKNLQEQKPEPSKDVGTAEAKPQAAQPLPLGERMTISEMDALALQLRNCWNVLAGARYAENLVVDLKLFMNSDGTLRQAVIVDQLRYNADGIYRAAADSALRAVRDPNCTPFQLPLDKYNDWKVINATFDPSQIL
jgi:hypothetical protein